MPRKVEILTCDWCKRSYETHHMACGNLCIYCEKPQSLEDELSSLLDKLTEIHAAIQKLRETRPKHGKTT